MRGVYVDQVFDPVTEEAYLEEGSSNVQLLNLDLHGGDTFYVRGSTDILIEGGEVGDATGEGETCKVGAAYQSPVLCERITIRGIHFHDMTLPAGSTQHHEALFICDSDCVLIEDCVFGPNIWGSTADLYFTAEQTLHLTSTVTIRGCRFLEPSSSGSSAIQWHDKDPAPDGMDPIDGYLLEGNLFEDCYPNFGTIKRPVSNFYVGVNYGMCPQTQYDHAVGLGITFEEYPFRPAEEWPGHGQQPIPPVDDPCAGVIAERDELQARIDEAIAVLQGIPAFSTDWWEHAYAGGPMVELPGFPRPMYPPSAAAHGKQPSKDGPDVIAYKRTVARLGRWPWQTYDDTFSDGFAHGTSGNVGETGVAGVQRQSDIDDTGWIGKATFNLLRSARCPEGPHEGEMAMDAYAAALLVDAWNMFGGHEPDEGGATLRRRALDKAVTQIGVKEKPPDSNQVKYCDWYGMVGPWCAMFVTWCYETAGGDSPGFVQGGRYAYVPYIVADARANKYGLSVTDDPIPGDLVCFDWAWDGEYDHVGLFENWGAGNEFESIEGNTSTSNNSNGGEVMRRTRNRGMQATTFVRVKEPA